MANKKKRSDKAQEYRDILGGISDNIRLNNKNTKVYKLPSIIEFVEEKKWLGMNYYPQPLKLRPMQRLALKAFYRGSPGNENLQLTSEDLDLINKANLKCKENGNLLEKWASGEVFSELVLVWGRRCLSEDSFVIDADSGYEWRLGDLWDYGKTSISTWTYNEKKQRMKVMNDCNLVHNGIQHTYDVRLTSGHHIEATNNHPLLTKDGWKKIENLQVGDKIAVSQSIPIFPQKCKLKGGESAFIGCLLSSKFSCKKSKIFSFTLNSDIISYFTDKVQKCTDYEVDFSTKELSDYSKNIFFYQKHKYKDKFFSDRKYDHNKITGKIKSWNNLINFNGLNTTQNEQQVIPTVIKRLNYNCCVEFLRALFTCDAEINKNKDSYNISIYFNNKEFASEIQRMLQRFGVFSCIKICTDKNKYIYKLSIYSLLNIKNFFEHIGIQRTDKNITECEKWIAQDISNSDEAIVFVSIRSIVPTKEKRTFDIQVSDEEHLQNFVSNGIVCHNSGKGFVSSIISLYEAMKLLEHPQGNPYNDYTLDSAVPMSIVTVANSSDQAELIFKEIRSKMYLSAYFQEKIDTKHTSDNKLVFLTPHDVQQNKILTERGLRTKEGSIQIYSGHSNSDSLVGLSCYCLVLDEIGVYKNTKGSSSGDSIYYNLKPAVQTYARQVEVRDKDTGVIKLDSEGNPKLKTVYDGKILCISTPRGKEGIFYSLYSTSHETDNRFMMRTPTWMVNDILTEESLRKESPDMPEERFQSEYGAQFSGAGGISFFSRDKVDECFKTKHVKDKKSGLPGHRYFAHLDPASSSHNYALVVCHREIAYNEDDGMKDYVVVVDHVKHWAPGPNKIIKVDEIDDYMIRLNQLFYFAKITYDQWHSKSSIEKLRRAGAPAIEARFTRKYKMQIYDNLENVVNSNRLIIPTGNEHYGLLYNEMVNLQRKWMENGYKVIPRHDGDIVTDDLCDSLAGAVYNCMDSVDSALPAARLANTPLGSSQHTFKGPQGNIDYQNRRNLPPSIRNMIDRKF